MRNTPTNFICVLALVSLSLSVNAQYVTDLTGKPMVELKYTDVQGTPYFSESWLNGSLKLNNGTLYKDVKLKYNQVDDLLVFQNKAGVVMNFVDPVSNFTLSEGPNEIVFRNGFKTADDTFTTNTFFQVLADGETPLIKRTKKKVNEYKEYNSATTTKNFQAITNYYLVKEGLPIKIKKDKKSVIEAFGDRKSELEVFIKANDINLKSDVDLIKLTTYYNSLK